MSETVDALLLAGHGSARPAAGLAETDRVRDRIREVVRRLRR
ncbi:hypothetical protein [Actinoplanes sp. HUAS TT8]